MKSRKIISVGEIFLLVSLSFAISFLMSENFVSGLATDIPASINSASKSTILSTTPGGASVVSAGTQITSGSVIGPGTILESGTATLSNGVILQAGQAVPAGQIATVATDSVIGGSGGTVAGAGSTLETFSGTATNTAGSGSILSTVFGGTAFGTGSTAAIWGGALLSGAVWGGIAYFAGKMIGSLFGLTDNQANSIGMGLGAGAFVGSTLYLAGANTIAAGGHAIPYLTTTGGALFWGVAVAAVVIVLTYKKEKKEIVSFMCEPWEAPTGGNRCDECNKDPLIPCSKYRCQSLGQACQIVNEGTGEELCVWTNKNDVTAPIVSTWEEALKPSGLIFREEGNGYKIIDPNDNKGCLQPFSRLEFGVETNEPAQCRLDIEEKENYNDMTYLLGDNNYDFEHAQTNFKTPNPFQSGEQSDEESPTIHNNGLYTFFVRCRDANGNGEDMAPFTVKFCVNEGPDTTPPQIEGFSIVDGSPVQYQVDKVPIEVYTNEPAECKWSKRDQDFSTMENPMSCSTYSYEVNAQLNYVCRTDLTGVVDRQNNDFYFRCKDKPLAPETERFEMRESKKLTLRGTEPLSIRKVGPDGEIKGSTTTVLVNLTVATAFGENDGHAYCYYSTSAEGPFDVAMLGYGTSAHNQPIALGAGDYTYYYRCVDKGGNIAENQTSFKVSVDTVAPIVVRAYKDGGNMKIITNEEAKCVYSIDRCDYDFTSGVPFSYEDASVGKRKVHYVQWDTDKTYYIKCEDYQGKRALPDQCSIIVKGSEL